MIEWNFIKCISSQGFGGEPTRKWRCTLGCIVMISTPADNSSQSIYFSKSSKSQKRYNSGIFSVIWPPGFILWCLSFKIVFRYCASLHFLPQVNLASAPEFVLAFFILLLFLYKVKAAHLSFSRGISGWKAIYLFPESLSVCLPLGWRRERGGRKRKKKVESGRDLLMLPCSSSFAERAIMWNITF